MVVTVVTCPVVTSSTRIYPSARVSLYSRNAIRFPDGDQDGLKPGTKLRVFCPSAPIRVILVVGHPPDFILPVGRPNTSDLPSGDQAASANASSTTLFKAVTSPSYTFVHL